MNEKKQDLDIGELNKEFQHEMEVVDVSDTVEEHVYRENNRKSNRRKNRNQKKYKKITPFRIVISVLCIIIVLLIVAVAVFFYLRTRGEQQLKENQTEETVSAPEEAVVEDEGKLVVYKGEQYCYNENVISILCMGIDKTIQEEDTENVIGENGQADTLFLAVLDTKSGKMSFLNISRDSMVDVNRYNVDGQYLGTEEMQICLAYSYGDGKKKSCQNVAESVSRLLYGMPVNAYIAMDYSGISVLNDEVGGVKVQVLEDLSTVDPALSKGAGVTLTGEQAHIYVRNRDTSELDSNNDRMARQRQYLLSFMSTVLQKTKEDISIPVTLFRSASDYMVTDIDVSEVTYLASRVLGTKFSEKDMYSVPGKVKMGDKYAEFYPDEETLYESILNIFYEKQ